VLDARSDALPRAVADVEPWLTSDAVGEVVQRPADVGGGATRSSSVIRVDDLTPAGTTTTMTQRHTGLSLRQGIPKCDAQKYCRSMRRGVAALVGLALLGGGVWLIMTEHSRTTGCTARTDLVSGVSNSCQSAAWIYFAGFVVVGFGLIVLLLASLMRRRETRLRRQDRLPSDYMLQLHNVESRETAEQ
jgi:hypothetical protein